MEFRKHDIAEVPESEESVPRDDMPEDAWRYNLEIGYRVDSFKVTGSWFLSIIKSFSTPEGERHNKDTVVVVHQIYQNDGNSRSGVSGYPRSLKLFSPHIQKPYTKTGDALTTTAARGNIGECELLIALSGADVNAIHQQGVTTALHAAAYHGHAGVCELLIDNGADVNARHETSFTPLHAAALNGHTGVCELLIKQGADITGKHRRGFTPLHLAAFVGHPAVCKLLVDLGASVNAKHKDHGGTPLYAAAEQGHSAVCELLITLGADVNAKYDGRWTPLYVSKRNGHTEVYDVLNQHGAHHVKCNEEGTGHSIEGSGSMM